MKKQFILAETQIISFCVESVITTSGEITTDRDKLYGNDASNGLLLS